MASIYELTQDLQELERLMTTDDEVETFFDTWEACDGEFEIKAEGYAKVMANLKSDIEGFKTEIGRLSLRKKTIENNVARLQKRLYEAMVETGKTNFKSGNFAFSIVKNGGVQGLDVDEDNVPEEYIKMIPEIDNDKIRKDLEEGKELEFARLKERGTRLSIR